MRRGRAKGPKQPGGCSSARRQNGPTGSGRGTKPRREKTWWLFGAGWLRATRRARSKEQRRGAEIIRAREETGAGGAAPEDKRNHGEDQSRKPDVAHVLGVKRRPDIRGTKEGSIAAADKIGRE